MFPAFSTGIVPTLRWKRRSSSTPGAFAKSGTFQDLFPARLLSSTRDGTALRPQRLRVHHDFKETNWTRTSARVLDPGRVPQRVRRLQQDVADPPRRLHHQADPWEVPSAHRLRGPSIRAAGGRRISTPTASRSTRRHGRRLLSVPPRLHQPSWVRDGGVQRGRQLANERAVRPAPRSIPRRTSSSTVPWCTSLGHWT